MLTANVSSCGCFPGRLHLGFLKLIVHSNSSGFDFWWETFLFRFFEDEEKPSAGKRNSVMKIVSGAGRAAIGGLLGHNILPCDPGKFPDRSGRNFLHGQERKTQNL